MSTKTRGLIEVHIRHILKSKDLLDNIKNLETQ